MGAYFVDRTCFNAAAIAKIVSLEEWAPDPRWIPYRYEATAPVARRRPIAVVDAPARPYHPIVWESLLYLVNVAETATGDRAWIEYVAEVYVDRLARVGIAARLVWPA